MSKLSVSKKNPNIEWLRVLAMLMVVVLHGLGKGGLFGNPFETDTPLFFFTWFLELLCIVSVNLYVLISGYLLSKSSFKSRRVLDLIAEVLFYSVVGFLVFRALGFREYIYPYTIRMSIFPLHMKEYWFMTAYIALYILTPVLNMAVKYFSKKQHLSVIILLLIIKSLFKTFIPLSFAVEDQGFSTMWFIVLYLTSAYFGKYGFGKLCKVRNGLLLYFGSVILDYCEYLVLAFVVAKTGNTDIYLTGVMDYNHLLVYLASVGLFAAGVNAPECKGVLRKTACFLGPLTLGVFLLHENILIRFTWVDWFGLPGLLGATLWQFIPKFFLAVICVFVAGIAVDFVREKLFDLARLIVDKTKIPKILRNLDDVINGNKN